ncbi:MAG: hypothetical protein HYW07_00630 [Candidatus Latescibacteria bacterium]|nr:hypothetical protein [Candidatus Latescibacterota bacterium]
MGNPEKEQQEHFERRYAAALLVVVAVLLLASILYTGRLWGVKAGIALGLLMMGGYFFFRARVSR